MSWNINGKERIAEFLEDLPKARLEKIEQEGINNPSNYKTVVVKNKIIGIVSGRFKEVAHVDAFSPILDALDTNGLDYSFNGNYTERSAWLNIFTKGSDAKDTVQLAFRVSNNLNGKGAVKYGFHVRDVGKKTQYIEVVGYRQICSNGMKITVPISEADNQENAFVKVSEGRKIKELLYNKVSYCHVGNVQQLIQDTREISEGLNLLKEPVSRMISAAEDKKLALNYAQNLVEEWIGKRHSKKVMAQYEKENQDLWGLFNAITNVASHDGELKVRPIERLLDGARDMLLAEVTSGADRQ